MTDNRLVSTWQSVDQVTTQHHEPGPGSEVVYSLHGLLGELHLLGPFVPVAVAVAVPPGFHQAQLRVRSLDEAKGSRPLTLRICMGRFGKIMGRFSCNKRPISNLFCLHQSCTFKHTIFLNIPISFFSTNLI